MRLPCKHIFAYRAENDLKLFDPDTCDPRWSQEYYYQHQRLYTHQQDKNESTMNQPISVSVSTPRDLKKMNHNEKFREANDVCTKLANLACEVGSDSFERRLHLLKDLQRIWENNDETSLLFWSEPQHVNNSNGENATDKTTESQHLKAIRENLEKTVDPPSEEIRLDATNVIISTSSQLQTPCTKDGLQLQNGSQVQPPSSENGLPNSSQVQPPSSENGLPNSSQVQSPSSENGLPNDYLGLKMPPRRNPAGRPKMRPVGLPYNKRKKACFR
ncbi:uncharacterized protein [Clytia hemisphaerica]|uniref:uncharacterized protein isoform X2 n=1 Tax=Clytia hemisphaerica TaxID=252671 RepID=UPI0034D5BFB7